LVQAETESVGYISDSPVVTTSGGGGLDILGLGMPSQPQQQQQPLIFGEHISTGTTYAGPPKPSLELSLQQDNESCPGLKVETMFVMHQDQVKLRMLVTNGTSKLLDSFLIKFRSNVFGAQPASTQVAISPIQPGTQGKTSITLSFGTERSEDKDLNIALKSAAGVAIFVVPLPFLTTLLPSGKMDPQTFATLWKQQSSESYFDMGGIITNQNTINSRLEENNIFFVTKAEKEGSTFLYHSCKVADGSTVLSELELPAYQTPRLCVNCSNSYSSMAVQAFKQILG